MGKVKDSKEFVKVLRKVEKYLTPKNGWLKDVVADTLCHFEEIHGSAKVEAMGRFIDWSEENKKDVGWIAAQLGHDLNECDKPMMLPRTAGY